ncbi:MAG: ABC transporter ATP-binding protein [Ignavibacteriales bacterium]|nr:ABC transporter ATP-binding protein [Ignavibacteriales bacterium]
MPEPNPILFTKNLAVGYKVKKSNDYILLDGLNLSVERGELICLLGSNGCGKSTLLRTLTGVQKPILGDIYIENKSIKSFERPQLAKVLSIVLTENLSADGISVFSLVSMGRYPHNNWLGMLTENDFKIINHILDITGLTPYKSKLFTELSDGFKQKVMIARALAQDTPLILLDEPTAYLDIPTRIEILDLIKSMTRQFNKAIIFSSHDLDLALQTADVIWLITKDQRIEVDAPEDLVINGHFEKAFNKKEVKFYPQRGIFKIDRATDTRINVKGDQLEVIWTERALERIGISTEGDQKIAAEIQIEKVNDRLFWNLEINSESHQFSSINELIKYFKKM